jgi:hypothetical protein
VTEEAENKKILTFMAENKLKGYPKAENPMGFPTMD